MTTSPISLKPGKRKSSGTREEKIKKINFSPRLVNVAYQSDLANGTNKVEKFLAGIVIVIVIVFVIVIVIVIACLPK